MLAASISGDRRPRAASAGPASAGGSRWNALAPIARRCPTRLFRIVPTVWNGRSNRRGCSIEARSAGRLGRPSGIAAFRGRWDWPGREARTRAAAVPRKRGGAVRLGKGRAATAPPRRGPGKARIARRPSAPHTPSAVVIRFLPAQTYPSSLGTVSLGGAMPAGIEIANPDRPAVEMRHAARGDFPPIVHSEAGRVAVLWARFDPVAARRGGLLYRLNRYNTSNSFSRQNPRIRAVRPRCLRRIPDNLGVKTGFSDLYFSKTLRGMGLPQALRGIGRVGGPSRSGETASGNVSRRGHGVPRAADDIRPLAKKAGA